MPLGIKSLVLRQATVWGISFWSRVCIGLTVFERKYFKKSTAGSPPAIAFRSSLRVALVKQTTYGDLYSKPSAESPLALVESSWLRTGPLGLFTEFESRFIIVRAEQDTECKIWEEKKVYWENNPVRRADDLRRENAQDAVSVRVDEVDWSQFDIVIAIENAVPSRITQLFPGVLWCTLLEHHKMSLYSSYLRRPPAGYDAFLNLRYGPNPRSLFRRRHVIDWPYNFTAPGALRGLLQSKTSKTPALEGELANRSFTVLLEDHQPESVADAFRIAGISFERGRKASLADYLATVGRVDALVFPCPSRPLGGLAMLDAASAGVLLVGNPRMLWNPFLLVPELRAATPAEAVDLVRRLSVDEEFRTKVRINQDARLAWFGFARPLRQIADLVGRLPRALTARHQLSLIH